MHEFGKQLGVTCVRTSERAKRDEREGSNRPGPHDPHREMHERAREKERQVHKGERGRGRGKRELMWPCSVNNCEDSCILSRASLVSFRLVSSRVVRNAPGPSRAAE